MFLLCSGLSDWRGTEAHIILVALRYAWYLLTNHVPFIIVATLSADVNVIVLDGVFTGLWYYEYIVSNSDVMHWG